MSSIFLSHSHADKPFVRKLAADLRRAGARAWVDEAEMQVGDSLIEKIREGIDEMEYVGAVLSPSSVASQWVQRELDVAMNQEIAGKRVKVLPILLQDCDMPGFLVGKLYADFRSQEAYAAALTQLLKRLGIEIKPPPTDSRSLFTLLNAAITSGDDDLTRKSLVGFLSLPEGAHRGLVRDVLGSISGWAQRGQNASAIDLSCQTIVDTFAALDDGSATAVEYLLNMPDYFKPPPKALARGVASPHIAVRIASNLALYGYGGYGNSSDAMAVAPDRNQSLALRVAAIHSLGLAAHTDAAGLLNQIASACHQEPQAVLAALVCAAEALGRRSSASEVLEAFQSIIMCSAVDPDTRRAAARRFLEVEKDLHDWARTKYDAVRIIARSLQAQ
jgi:tellurite resistance protein